MRNSLSIAVAGCLSVVICAQAGLAITTQPSQSDIPALISQLGDDNFAVREDAEEKLQQIGDAAKGALEQAAAGGDPEVKLRASDLLHRLDTPPFPGPAPDAIENNGLQVHVDQMAGVIDETDQGRSIHIQKGADGIDMTVRGYIDGKPVTAHYKATDPDDLKRQSPEAYAQFQQLESGGGEVELMQNNGRMVIVRGGTLLINPQAAEPPTDDFAKLSADLITQMENKRFTDAQENKIRDEVEHVRQMKEAQEDAARTGDPNGVKQNDYLKACDDLRKQLADAGLADPGAILPPPAGSRLGVSVDSEGFDGAVVINHVDKDSRGDKIGLMDGDVVHAANGKPINNVADLRNAATNEKNLTLSVLRSGQELTLQEPAADKH
jgi:hypothetical protein